MSTTSSTKKKKKLKASASASASAPTTPAPPATAPRRKILLLHGDRQTGGLLLGRISSLKRKLLKPRDSNNTSNHTNANSNGNGNANTSVNDHRIEIVAPDGPFVWALDPSIHHEQESGDDSGGDGTCNRTAEEQAERDAENDLMRTWWHRENDQYHGLDESLNMLQSVWSEDEGFEGIIGFSRGARMTHLIGLLHEASNGCLFPRLKYIVMASGYGGVNLPTNFPSESLISHYKDLYSGRGGDRDGASTEECRNDFMKDIEAILPLKIRSMHIMGLKDRLVPVESSRALLSSYVDPVLHEHDGGHHIPMRAADVREILGFIDSAAKTSRCNSKNNNHDENGKGVVALHAQQDMNKDSNEMMMQVSVQSPDEEHAQLQIDECESMKIIFPDEFEMLSTTEGDSTDAGANFDGMNETKYNHPISYAIQLKPSAEQLEEEGESSKELWPKDNISLRVQYTPEYPDALPIFSLKHEMNLLEFKISQDRACLDAVEEAAKAESGMPCVMSCVYAAREWFEGGGLLSSSKVVQDSNNVHGGSDESGNKHKELTNLTLEQSPDDDGLIKASSSERIEKCKLEGLQISYSVGGYLSTPNVDSVAPNSSMMKKDGNDIINGKGGSWKYTIGLVGKPSAGKSTFFNAASAFARQRGGDNTDEDGIALGGATMAPHPFTTIDPNVGYCLVPAPKGSCPEDDCDNEMIACSHGRDMLGRRLIPVMLKDVAGLVPGAYKGRGRGNKFLDDLLDADVLIHVLDASGTADTEGNKVVVDGDKNNDSLGSDPLNDIAWVHNELIQWIVANLKTRWNTISRKGRQKLVSMFSGYKQSESFVWDVLLSVEKFLLSHEGRDRALDNLKDWDEGDLYRLVTAFLGVRFPTALALNKYDIPSSKIHCERITSKLPLHGAHVGTFLCAEQEMQYVRHHIYSAIAPNSKKNGDVTSSPPIKVWDCLQSAMKLREPVLVFPVLDMESYQPLPGMFNSATRDSSLPSLGMIACLKAAGGKAPSMWDCENKLYYASPGDVQNGQTLRDVLVMKPNSTVEDVFDVLKRMGALGGEYVRAEAAENIGMKPNLVKKDELVTRSNRILKIMTTRRREWQKTLPH